MKGRNSQRHMHKKDAKPKAKGVEVYKRRNLPEEMNPKIRKALNDGLEFLQNAVRDGVRHEMLKHTATLEITEDGKWQMSLHGERRE